MRQRQMCGRDRVAGKRTPWVPGRLRQVSFERKKFRAAVARVRPWTERVDRLLKPRLRALTVWPFNRIGACLLYTYPRLRDRTRCRRPAAA